MNTEEFVKRSKDKHGDAYDYSKSVFVNKKTKVEIYCPKHDLILRDEIKSDYCKNNYIELICLSDTNEIESKLNKFSELQLV